MKRMLRYSQNISIYVGYVAINTFRGEGSCTTLASFDPKMPTPLTLINGVKTLTQIFHINGDPPYISENFL